MAEVLHADGEPDPHDCIVAGGRDLEVVEYLRARARCEKQREAGERRQQEAAQFAVGPQWRAQKEPLVERCCPVRACWTLVNVLSVYM